MNERHFISRYGLFASIVVTVVGVGIFSYPGRMANEVGTDGWVVTVIAGIICSVLLALIYKVVKRHEYVTFYEMLENNFGRLISKAVAFIICVYFIASIALGMRVFAEVIKMYLLEQTPTEFILLVMIFTGLYLVRGEITALVKFNEISLIVMFVPMIIVLMFTTRGGNLTNVLPVFQNKPVEYVSALSTAAFAFGGFEIAFLMLPFMKEKKGVTGTLIKSILFITLFYVAVIVLTLMFFTKEHTKVLLWPTITLIRAIVIPGAFVERWEGIVMTLWVLFYFTTFANIFYFAGDVIKSAFNLHDIKLSSIILAPIIYIVALYPENIAEVYDFSGKITPVFFVFTVVLIPVLLLFTKGVRGRRKIKNEC